MKSLSAVAAAMLIGTIPCWSSGAGGTPAGRSRGGENVFVGNFGEVLSYPADYEAEARMHGDKEVVVFHPNLYAFKPANNSYAIN